jgi:hypothetical protein
MKLTFYYRDIQEYYSLDSKSMVSNETIVENRYLSEHFSVNLYQYEPFDGYSKIEEYSGKVFGDMYLKSVGID